MENQNITSENIIPEPVSSTLYIAGYLNTQIGKLVKVEFLIGDSTTDRIGTLVKVGVNYILIKPIDVNGLILCDLYSIKFVTIIEKSNPSIYGGFGIM